MAFKTLNDVLVRSKDVLERPLKGKRILFRADLNLPFQNGKIIDCERIEHHKPSIDALCNAGAIIIMLSHFGRPKGRDPKMSLERLIPDIEKTLGRKVDFCPVLTGEKALQTITRSKNQIILLENTRFYEGETSNDMEFARQLSLLGDIYVNDSFSVAHRANASTSALAQFLPSYAGLALDEEIKKLNLYLKKPKKPALAIIGGAKISSKIGVLEGLLPMVDRLAIGGAMANAFLVAQNIISSDVITIDDDTLDKARRFYQKAQKSKVGVILPIDMVVAKQLKPNIKCQNLLLKHIPAHHLCLDIGAASVERLGQEIDHAQTILWNGPLGAYETPPFDRATLSIARKIANASKLSIAGGGETLAALNKAGVKSQFTYISTGGGAFLEWLEGKSLPAILALERNQG